MEKEKCVLCGIDTEYDKDTDIKRRKYYTEGAGQLCSKCFSELQTNQEKVSLFYNNYSNALENCVLCKKQLNIKKNMPISMRAFYIEGAGQLCSDCYKKIYGKW